MAHPHHEPITRGAPLRFHTAARDHHRHECRKIKPTGLTGIHEVYAVIPRQGNPSEVFEVRKTTYDPAICSDAEMNRMAREAGKLAWNRFQSGDPGNDAKNPNKVYVVEVNGVHFRALINMNEKGEPYIGNVHPYDSGNPP